MKYVVVFVTVFLLHIFVVSELMEESRMVESRTTKPIAMDVQVVKKPQESTSVSLINPLLNSIESKQKATQHEKVFSHSLAQIASEQQEVIAEKKVSETLLSTPISKPQPPYPQEARIKRQQGVVTLVFEVNKSGVVEHVILQESSGYALLDESAINTAKTWLFNPTLVDGQTVNYWYQQKVSFALEVEKKTIPSPVVASL